MMELELGKAPSVVQGRSCGSCSLCCKVFGIDELSKPAGTWCSHCRVGKDCCTIYENRPSVCRDFLCGWLISPGLGEAWHPLKSKMVVSVRHSDDGKITRILVNIDTDFPLRRKTEPYYSRIKAWAQFAVDNDCLMAVYEGERVIVVFPNKEVDLGELEPGDRIMTFERKVPNGRDWGASVQKAKDIPENTVASTAAS